MGAVPFEDTDPNAHLPVKDIYVYPLTRHFREILTHGPA